MIQSIDPAFIDPNPYQSRAITPDSVQDLVADLKLNGLQQRPRARVSPLLSGEGSGVRYQLAFGHRRLAAWQIAFPGQPIEVDVADLSDRQLFDDMIAENAQRDDINAIEKARSIAAYIAAFGVTQAEAGQRFNLKTQAGVSNLLSLLKLPAEIQDLVAAGTLPERLARRLGCRPIASAG